MPNRLKLIAMDAEDLSVVSAHCQDAVLKVAGLSWLAGERRFVVTMNRFVWEGAESAKTHERRQSVLHFERVAKVAFKGIDRRRKDTVLALLAITFSPSSEPAGTVELAFAGGPTLRLDVECVEAKLTDLAAAWETASRPAHEA